MTPPFSRRLRRIARAATLPGRARAMARLAAALAGILGALTPLSLAAVGLGPITQQSGARTLAARRRSGNARGRRGRSVGVLQACAGTARRGRHPATPVRTRRRRAHAVRHAARHHQPAPGERSRRQGHDTSRLRDLAAARIHAVHGPSRDRNPGRRRGIRAARGCGRAATPPAARGSASAAGPPARVAKRGAAALGLRRWRGRGAQGGPAQGARRGKARAEAPAGRGRRPAATHRVERGARRRRGRGAGALTEADRERAQQELANSIEAETVILRQRIVELTAMVERMQQEVQAQEAAQRAAEAAAKAPPPAPEPDWWEANALAARGHRRPAAPARCGPPLEPPARCSARRPMAPDARAGTTRAASAGCAPGARVAQRAGRAGASRTGNRGAGTRTTTRNGLRRCRRRRCACRFRAVAGHRGGARLCRARPPRSRHRGPARAHPEVAAIDARRVAHAARPLPRHRSPAGISQAGGGLPPALQCPDAGVGGFAPDDPGSDGLAAFPHILKQVADLWRKPECRTYLERLLYDNREGRRTGFPLATYADILTLLQVLDAPEPVDIDLDLVGRREARSSAARAGGAIARARGRADAAPPRAGRSRCRRIRRHRRARCSSPSSSSSTRRRGGARRRASRYATDRARPSGQHALFEVDHPVRLLGGLRVVRHHHDRLADLPVQPLQQAENLLRVVRSRSPVGSSATMSVGSAMSARAIATRCCWPPESSFG